MDKQIHLPKVSVIIPTYNCGQYVSETIQSVKNQTYSEIEIIVIDDGSTDDTPNVLKKFGTDITIITQPNSGVSAARNKGIKIAHGEYIAILDADDIWHPSRIEKMMDFFLNSQFDIIISNFYRIDEYGNRLSQKPAFSESYKEPDIDKQFTSLLYQATTFGLMIVKKELLLDVRGYDEDLKGEAEDYDLWLRLLNEGASWGFFEEPLVEVRVRVGSLSRGYSRNRKAALKKIFQKQIPYIGKLKSYYFYRYHLGGYRWDMVLVSIKEKNKDKFFEHVFIMIKSPLFIPIGVYKTLKRYI